MSFFRPIERKYGEAIQIYLTVIAMNLKRMVKLLTGVNFKGRAHIGA